MTQPASMNKASQGSVHDTFPDLIQVQQRTHGLADLVDGLLVVVFQAIKHPVDELLRPVSDGVEKKHNRQNKNERKHGGLCDLKLSKATSETSTNNP